MVGVSNAVVGRYLEDSSGQTRGDALPAKLQLIVVKKDNSNRTSLL